MRVAVRGETPDLDAPARQGKHGVAARRVSERADARAARILRDAIAPLRIAEDGVEDTRDLSGPLVEIRSGPSFEEAVVLPVVARVAQRGDEIARARERLLEALVIQLCAALAMADHDETLERRGGLALRRHMREIRTHRDGTFRGLRRVVQVDGNRRRGAR